MRILKKWLSAGSKPKQRMTIELEEDEALVVVKANQHYSLGEPLIGEILPGHTIADIRPAHWCPVSQKWVE